MPLKRDSRVKGEDDAPEGEEGGWMGAEELSVFGLCLCVSRPPVVEGVCGSALPSRESRDEKKVG